MGVKSLMNKMYLNVYIKIFPDYIVELDKAIGNTKTLLDVGCGSDSPIRRFSKRLHTIGIDGFQPSIDKSRKKHIHDEYIKMNLLDIGKKFSPDSFGCVLASDVIEHFTKEEGNKLIQSMEKIAKEKIVIFTPNGFLPQGEYRNNPYQVHRSGWSVNEMRENGYRVIGINGWKPLRGENASLRFWPRFFWMIISDITQLYCRNHPEKAFHILCIKNKE